MLDSVAHDFSFSRRLDSKLLHSVLVGISQNNVFDDTLETLRNALLFPAKITGELFSQSDFQFLACIDSVANYSDNNFLKLYIITQSEPHALEIYFQYIMVESYKERFSKLATQDM